MPMGLPASVLLAVLAGRLLVFAASIAATKAAATYDSPPRFLELAPAAQPASQAYWNTSLDTWGGSVIADDVGRYHLFAAAMAGGCSLGQWATNSFVMHSVAETPTGPFARAPGAAGTAVGLWAHNPQVVRHTDGTFLLFSIGKQNATKACTCQRPVPAGFCPRPKIYPWADLIQLHYAKSLDGPWTSLGTVIIGSNPSPFVLNSTGEVFVAFKGGMQIARAEHWRGPYKVITPLGGVLPPSGRNFPIIEDAFLWHDPKSRRWNSFFHQYSHDAAGLKLDGPGGYAFSEVDDILNWTWGLRPGQTVYDWNVSLLDHSSLLLHSRQRPKLLLDSHGQPSVLYNGVSSEGHCHTFAQTISKFVPPY